MRYIALATDYDGTLAQGGRVTEQSIAALEKLRGSGRKLILVTGRELDELLGIFPGVRLFDRVVAENGALIYEPATRAVRILAPLPPTAFIDSLRRRNVTPLSIGRVIVATWKPHETVVLETIRDLGLDLQVIFNKEAVMVLPASVNKASGLSAALKELELSPHEVVGVGDAENDHALLAMSECSVAVQNALPTLKDRADLVTAGDHGRGVEQLIQHLLDNDLRHVEDRLGRHSLRLGRSTAGEEIRFAPFGENLLITGPSGCGKSTICKSVLERLLEQHYQFCIIDPEGDYDGLDGAVTIGNSKHAPTLEEILPLLKNPETNVVVNLVGLPLADRPAFFLTLLPRLQAMRASHGRPHRIAVDEAHNLLPADWGPSRSALLYQPERMIFITVHPEQVAKEVLAGVSTLVAVGAEPAKTIERFCYALNIEPPLDYSHAQFSTVEPGQVVLWARNQGAAPMGIQVTLPIKEHQRQSRKYAEGELPPERCFYFKGPKGKLNLRVQNLLMFNQIGAGVDDATWLFHLVQGDYSQWFRSQIHDETLAAEAAQIERLPKPSATKTRSQFKELIERHYTLLTAAPLPRPGNERTSKNA